MPSEVISEEILKILKQIKESPAMNGAFDDLVSKVDDIKKNQSTVITKQEATHETIKDLKEALYHPDSGIYKRIGDVRHDTDEIKEEIKTFGKDIKSHETRIIGVEATDDLLKKIGGDSLQHITSAVYLNKNTKRLFWAFLAALSALAAKAFWPILAGLI